MTISRMSRGQYGKILAFFDIKTDEGFIMKGFKIVDGNDGLFVGFPSQKKDDDTYHQTIQVEKDNKELKDKVTVMAISYYQQEMEVPLADKTELPF